MNDWFKSSSEMKENLIPIMVFCWHCHTTKKFALFDFLTKSSLDLGFEVSIFLMSFEIDIFYLFLNVAISVLLFLLNAINLKA